MALGVGDDWILLDCPHPVRKMLREASERARIPLDLADIRAVILSHLHADHCSGLEDYAYFSHFALGRKATLIAHPDVSSRLWPNALSAGMDAPTTPGGPPTSPDTYYDLIDLDASRPITVGTVFDRVPLNHPPRSDHRGFASRRAIDRSDSARIQPLIRR